LIGNKIDLGEDKRAVSEAEGKQFAAKKQSSLY